jgi:curved DNA-binding protein CbpA
MMNHLTTMKLSQCFMILNVSPRVTWEGVKKSYHQLAKQYHPDLNPRSISCENKFKELNNAFKILETHYKNPKKNGWKKVSSLVKIRPESSTPYVEESLLSAEAIEEERQSNLSEPAGVSGEKKSGWNRWVQSIKARLNQIERKVFLMDTQKNIRVAPRTAEHGGFIRLQTRKESFQVKIPSGGWNRMSLRVPEKGESSFLGKKRGDLILNIQVIKPEQLEAGNSKFFYELHVPREKIIASKVQTLDSVQGPIKFVLPRGTKDGQTFVLKYQAKPDSKTTPDHVVKVHVLP